LYGPTHVILYISLTSGPLCHPFPNTPEFVYNSLPL
jgi:hypothetical protein